MAKKEERRRDRFPTTSWGVVLAAGCILTAESRPALGNLCEAYWFPLYAFLRRDGQDHEAAQDLVQGFFARLLERRRLAQVTREGGKFRSYLLTALKHFLVNEHQRRSAKKRAGGRTTLSLDLDFADADRRYLVEPSTDVTPERLYEQRWALTLLDNVLSDLGKEFEESGTTDRYEVLEEFLPGGRHQLTYQQAADRLGISVGATKVAVHRLRVRYRRKFRDTVADTVEAPDDVDGEVQYLFDVLGS